MSKPITCDSCNRPTNLLIWWPGDRWYCPRCDVERIRRGEEFKIPDKYIKEANEYIFGGKEPTKDRFKLSLSFDEKKGGV